MVVTGNETVGCVNFRWQMPRYESTMGDSVGLCKGIAESGLSPKVHVSEEKLAN